MGKGRAYRFDHPFKQRLTIDRHAAFVADASPFGERVKLAVALAREDEDGRLVGHAQPLSIRTKWGKLRLVNYPFLH